jgi:hypothetical protein
MLNPPRPVSIYSNDCARHGCVKKAMDSEEGNVALERGTPCLLSYSVGFNNSHPVFYNLRVILQIRKRQQA